MKACRMDVLSHWLLIKSSMSPAEWRAAEFRNTRKRRVIKVFLTSSETWAGCRQSCWQSDDGDSRRRETRAWIHAGLWVDAPMAPVTRLAGEHARTGTVRWGRGKRSAIWWLARRMIKLRVMQCLLIGRRSIAFRSHLSEAHLEKEQVVNDWIRLKCLVWLAYMCIYNKARFTHLFSCQIKEIIICVIKMLHNHNVQTKLFNFIVKIILHNNYIRKKCLKHWLKCNYCFF